MIVVAEVPGVDSGVDRPGRHRQCAVAARHQGGPATCPNRCSRFANGRLGAFHRQITLPNEVDFDKAQAEANHGILKIRLPKRTAAKPRTIPIKRG